MSITICRPVDLRCIFNQNYQHIRDGPTILGLTKAHGQLKSNIESNMEVNVGQTPNWIMFDQWVYNASETIILGLSWQQLND